ncbi:MAG: cytochrome c [Cyclobacteriaceae bacterium]
MSKYHIYYVLIMVIALAGCEAEGDYPGLEYAPQMYHSTPYEPLTQITDQSAGTWLSSLDNGVGEYYNSNPNNPYGMNARVPPANTVRRTASGLLPYRLPADSIELASRILKNPLDSTDAVLKQGQTLYNQYCYPCHGGAGQGDGPVGVVYKGVPAYNKGRYRDMTEGHIFHTITWGRGRMNPHGSQVDIADRWKIVRYVQTLQQQ